MWNTTSWIDKAKNMAANIDKQLNESVGVEGDESNASASAAAVVAKEEDTNDTNAWNDDFGFDDEEDVPVQLKPTIPLPVVSTLLVTPPPAPLSLSQPPPSPVPVVAASPATRVAAAPAPIVSPPEQQQQPTMDSTAGWDQHDDNDPLLENNDDDEEEVVDMQQENSFSYSPENHKKVPQALSAASSMLSSFATKAAPQISSLSSFATNVRQATTTTTTTTQSSPESSSAPMPTTPMSSLLSAVPTKTMEPEELSSTLEPEPTPTEAGWDDDLGMPEYEGVENWTEQQPPTVPTTPKPEPPPTTPTTPPMEAPLAPAPPKEEASPAPVPTPEFVVVVAPPPSNEEPVLLPPVHESSPPVVLLAPEPAPVVEEPKMVAAVASLVPASAGNMEDDPRYQQLKQELALREQQLASKSEQLTELQTLWETQEQDLRHKIYETKEEAKKRIGRAKERCEIAEGKLRQQQSSGAESSGQQDHLIAELRAEGEKLAKKQSKMEQSVRSAMGEARDLADQLEDVTKAKSQGLEKIAKLEVELKGTKESLANSRKGESQAGKLEDGLLVARSDAEMKAATILSLQQKNKELSAEGKELRDEIEKIRKLAAQDAHQEKKTLRREHNDVISDLETKLRTTEREAGVREDALRHEVGELRKRWQDAVRRADAVSMDVQSSTAPLLRQLESMERQSRARAAAWAELETRLRSELEETVIQNETLSKERSEFKTKYTRLERSVNERESELKQSKRALEDQTAKITKLEAQLVELEAEGEKRQEEYSKVERLANEGVMRVRSEMTQTVVDSEDRYRGQIDKLETDLRVEREKRSQVENQVGGLLENAGIYMASPHQAPETFRRESKPQKLRKGEGQAEILAGALGLDSDDDDEDDEDDFIGNSMDRGSTDGDDTTGSMHSFAALEQLSSRLRVAQIELEALRKNLIESEKTRQSLVEELGESRHAKEKLPLFEAKVKELTEDNREKELEIRGLRDDIVDVRELYRTQLNILLEEKATLAASSLNGGGPAPSSTSSGAPKPEENAEPAKPEEEAEPTETAQPENQ